MRGPTPTESAVAQADWVHAEFAADDALHLLWCHD
jgi:hypothetical protein